MGLLSIFQRKKQTAAKSAKSGRSARPAARQAPAAAPAEPADAVREARARARRRLMGATVLLLIGVIGFPLLFETQPRPIPVDLPIEIPSRNGTVTVDAPSAQAVAPRAKVSGVAAPTASAAASSIAPTAGLVNGRPSSFAPLASALGASAARVAAPAVASNVASAAPIKPAHAAAPSAALATTAPSHAGTTAAPSSSSGQVAAALLAGKSPDAATEAGRFVVQIGAFADDAKMHEARAKVEKLGLKTYTQAVDTPSGKRVRVRVGPYPTKAEADKAAARIKSDGLPAAVLAL